MNFTSSQDRAKSVFLAPGHSRRRFLQGMGATVAAAPLLSACATQAESDPSFFSRNDLPVGLQLYTLGDLTTTDLDGTLNKVAQIGYRTVETANYMGQTPAQLRAKLDAAGLSCTGAHVGLREGTPQEPGLLGDLSRLSDHMNTIGAGHVVCPILSPPADIVVEPRDGEGFRVLTRIVAQMTEDHWKRLAEQLNTIGDTLRSNGIRFGYHNHNTEFVRVGGRTGLDILIMETDPDLVTFELDVGWVAAAGADPVEVFNQYPGRFELMHVKEIQASTTPNIDLHMDPTQVGAGRLEWSRLLPAAYAAGVRKFYVEQEPPFTMPRLDAVTESFAYLSALEA